MISHFKLLPLLTLGLFSVKVSTAQNMAAVNSMLNRQFMNNMMNTNMQMSMLSLNNNSDFNKKYKFTVIDIDSTTHTVKSKIHIDTTLHKYYLEYEDKNVPKNDPKRTVKIYSDQTKSIERTDAYGAPVTGIATDSCWLFQVINGSVSAYTPLAETPDFYDPNTIIGLQKNLAPVVRFSADNLKAMIKDDKEALEQFNKKKYIKAIDVYNRNKKKAQSSK